MPGLERQHIEIEWNMVVARMLLIKQLDETDIKELHQMEDTRAERYYGHTQDFKERPECYPNWLIMPFNIQQLFFRKCKIIPPTSGERQAIIDIIKRHINNDILPAPSHSASVAWQHAWDWGVKQNVPVLSASGKKSNNMVDYMNKYERD